MVGDAQVLLNFVEVIVVDNGDGVLLCIVGLLLQSLIQLREAQRLGVGTQSGHGSHDDGVLGGADQQTVHVGRAVDGALGVGHAAEAVAVVGQHTHILAQQAFLSGSLDVAVHECPCIVEGLELERQCGNAHLCIVGGKVGSVGDDDIHRAGIQSDGVDQVSIAAQLAGGVQLNFHSAAGLFGNFFCKLLCALCTGVFFVGGEAQLQGDSRAGSGSGRTGGSCSRGSGSSSAGAGAAAGSQTQSSSGNASHLQEVTTGNHLFHKNSPSNYPHYEPVSCSGSCSFFKWCPSFPAPFSARLHQSGGC